jgi:hypothetical protein
MHTLDPAQIDVTALPSVQLQDRRLLPNSPAIYFVLDAASNVQYIGRAKSLCIRWQVHHRLTDFRKIANVYIAYLAISDVTLLPQIERALIEYFDPPLNHRCIPAAGLKQTALRVDAEVLRKARFYLDTEHKNVNEFLVEQLVAYIDAHERDTRGRRRPRRTPVLR